MSLLDDHLLHRSHNPEEALTALLKRGETLLWSSYQRPTVRMYAQLAIEGLFWVLGMGTFVLALWISVTVKGLYPLLFITVLVALVASTIVPTRLLHYYRRLRYPKSTLYGATQDHLLILTPWQLEPSRHAFATIPSLKIFARIDGTFTVSHLAESLMQPSPSQLDAWEKPQKLMAEKTLILDAWGGRETVDLLKRLQREAQDRTK